MHVNINTFDIFDLWMSKLMQLHNVLWKVFIIIIIIIIVVFVYFLDQFGVQSAVSKIIKDYQQKKFVKRIIMMNAFTFLLDFKCIFKKRRTN